MAVTMDTTDANPLNMESNQKRTRNRSIVPCWTMHTGRMSGHCTKKGVNYYNM